MQMLNFSRSELPFFGRLVELLDTRQEALIPLIGQPFSVENFGKQMALKEDFSKEKRAVLFNAIQRQYTAAGIEVPPNAHQLLENNAFTVCTGHQLNVLTGPLYTIYKIAHVIKLAEQLNIHYPDQKIIPVFWMATEDHDLDEIDHFHVGDRKIQWSTDQTGAVGRMSLENWTTWQAELHNMFPNQSALLNTLLESYQGIDLAQATLRLYQFLFRDTNLVIVNGDDQPLKASFVPVMEKEIREQFAQKATQTAAEILEEKHLKEQAFAREINLFYLGQNSRSRLELTENQNIKIGDTLYTQEEIIALLHKSPEHFSPNVILRPAYQESVLPNLCYVGGSGELAYWLQLKPVFDAVNLVYPMLQLRFSAQIMSAKQQFKMEKLGFTFPTFSQKRELVAQELFKRLSNRTNVTDALEYHLAGIAALLETQATEVDKTLIPAANAETKRISNLLKHFEEKLKRNERRKHTDALQRLDTLHQTFFPNDNLQERHTNFVSFYLDSQGKFISHLLSNLDCLNTQFIVLITHE